MYITLFHKAKDATVSSGKESKIPSMMRRRLTPFGKMVMESFYAILPELNKLDILKNTQWVISCRHGDTHRMTQLLSNLSQGEILSPTDFSFSVHNSLVALFSIETQNTQNNIALSGGDQSFEMGFVEAYALAQTTNQPVGYFYYEMPLPEIYKEMNELPLQPLSLIIVFQKEPSIPCQNSAFVRYGKNYESSTDISFNDDTLIDFLTKSERKENQSVDKHTFTLSCPGGFFFLNRV